MMVSSTPCCARPERALRCWGWLLLALWLGFAAVASAAERSAVRQATLRATPQGYALDSDVDIVLNATLEDALTRGIPLHFLLELEITRPRAWWFAEDIAEPVRKMRIYYHLLLRRYVIESGYRTQTAPSLAEALALLGHVEEWPVLERGALKAGASYEARLRLRLDTAQLPKPLSIGAVTGDKWELATPWHAWSFEPPIPSRSAPPTP